MDQNIRIAGQQGRCSLLGRMGRWGPTPAEGCEEEQSLECAKSDGQGQNRQGGSAASHRQQKEERIVERQEEA